MGHLFTLAGGGSGSVVERLDSAAYQVKPMFRRKCPSLRLRIPPPALCTTQASKMMAKITTTSQKKNNTIPGIAYPATLLVLATSASYPRLKHLCAESKGPFWIKTLT